jgi:DNA-directed RNA polymerase subunit K
MKEKESYSRYEKTRILSARALQIAQGSPVMVDAPKSVTSPLEIARLEWDAGVITIDIKPRSYKKE